MFTLLVAMTVMAAPEPVIGDPSACPCDTVSACADARCASRGGSGSCACRPTARTGQPTGDRYAHVPAPKFLVEPEHERWNALYARVQGGEKLTVYAGVPKPPGADGEMVPRTADGQTGIFSCFLSGGKPCMERVERSEAAPRAGATMPAATVPGHEHRCDRCGTVWAHPDGDPNASHHCPKCGRTQYVQLRSVAIPAAKTPAVSASPSPAPIVRPMLREAAPLFDLRRFTAPSRSNCPNGQCPNAPRW